MPIPVIVGVTGHRDLRESSIPALRRLVRGELEKIKSLCPYSELIMLSSLAAGADSLCAEEALKLGYRLVCPLPVEPDVYRLDFSKEEAERFDALLASAEKVFIAPQYESAEENRSYRFRQDGIYLAEHCHVLLALWDGSPAKQGGCGTAEAVDFTLNRSYKNDEIRLSPSYGSVIHVLTPRESKRQDFEPSVKLLESEQGSLERILRQTDEFNRECKALDGVEKTILPRGGKPETLAALEKCNAQAAALSRKYQNKYLRSLRILSAFCVMLVMSYLIYDEGELMLMLPLFALVLVFYYLVFRRISKGEYHKKYIDYRMLAESLRVQTFMCALGIKENAAAFYTWTQKEDSAWIKSAVSSILDGREDYRADGRQIEKLWIEGQLEYHSSAYVKNSRKNSLASNITAAMLICTILLFIAVCALEFFCRPFMLSTFLGVSWRSWFKILWGSISAVSLFVSGYLGNLSFSRKAEDNQKMAKIFSLAKRKCSGSGADVKAICLELAREEIIENGNWASYCKENRPMFTL